MQITKIQATNMEMTEAIRSYVEEKVMSLAKLTQNFEPVKCDVEVADESGRHKQGPYFRCEFNCEIPGSMLRAEAVHEDLYAAIDLAKDDLRRQLYRKKEKLGAKQRKGEKMWKKLRNAVPFMHGDDEM